MAKRPCSVPGCPTLTSSSRCPTHTRERDKARGTREQRGYGMRHLKERAKWQAIIDRTGWPCTAPHCLTPNVRILPGDTWQLGHSDDRTAYHGPEHPACNLHAAGLKRHGL